MMWQHPGPILSDRDFERLSYLSHSVPVQRQRMIAKALNVSRIYPSDKVPENLVTMNSEVILQDVDARARFRIKLVYPFNSDPLNGKVSVDSDLGSKMLGTRIGQVFLAEGIDGKLQRLAVIGIPYQPEAAGNYE